MAEQTLGSKADISPVRLRVGVLLIILWWIPFWALAPWIASQLSTGNNDHTTAVITTIIVVIQTILGGLGIYIAGRQAYQLLKDTPKKQVPRKLWTVLRHGTTK